MKLLGRFWHREIDIIDYGDGVVKRFGQRGVVSAGLILGGIGIILLGILAATVGKKPSQAPRSYAENICPSGEIDDPEICRRAGCDPIFQGNKTVPVCCEVVDGQRRYVNRAIPDDQLNCYVNTCTRMLTSGQDYPTCTDPRGTNPLCCTKTYQTGGNRYCEYPCNPTRCTQSSAEVYSCKPVPTATPTKMPTPIPSTTPRPSATSTPTSTPPMAGQIMTCPWPKPGSGGNHPPDCPFKDITTLAPALKPQIPPEWIDRFFVSDTFFLNLPWRAPRVVSEPEILPPDIRAKIPPSGTLIREYRWTVYMIPPGSNAEDKINCYESLDGFGILAPANSSGIQDTLPAKCQWMGARYQGSVRAIYTIASKRGADGKFFDCCRVDEQFTNWVQGPLPPITETPVPPPQEPPGRGGQPSPSQPPQLPPQPSVPPPGAPGSVLCTTSGANVRDINSCNVFTSLGAGVRVRVNAGPVVYEQCRGFDNFPRYDVTIGDNTRGLIAVHLLGQCLGAPIPSIPPNSPPSGLCTANCPCGHEDCSVANLKTWFASFAGPGDTVELIESKAKKASAICQAESGSQSRNSNKRCLALDRAKRMCDYSIGYFQINLLAHCREAFDLANFSCPAWPERPPNQCVISNNRLLEECERRYEDPANNIRKMINLSQNGTNWNAWQWTANRCGIR